MLNPKQAANLYNVQPQTLKLWAEKGLINCQKTSRGHRRYPAPEIIDEQTTNPDATCRNWIYCRVSSSKQKSDLNRQVEYVRKRFPCHGVISDIASGANFNRTGLKRLLARVDSGSVDRLVVANKDRLARIGFPIIDFLLKRRGVTLTILDCDESKTSEEEAAEELISIITYYTAKFYGKRKYTGGSNEEDQVLSDSVSEDSFTKLLEHISVLLQQSFSLDKGQENSDASKLERANTLLLQEGR